MLEQKVAWASSQWRQSKGRRFRSNRLMMRALKDQFQTPPDLAKAPEGSEKLAGGGARNERNHRNGRARLYPPRRGGRSDRSFGGPLRVGSVRRSNTGPFSRPSGAHRSWVAKIPGVPLATLGPPPATLFRPSGTLPSSCFFEIGIETKAQNFTRINWLKAFGWLQCLRHRTGGARVSGGVVALLLNHRLIAAMPPASETNADELQAPTNPEGSQPLAGG